MKNTKLSAGILFLLIALPAWANAPTNTKTHQSYGKLKVGEQLPDFDHFVSLTDGDWTLKRMIRKNRKQKAYSGLVMNFFRTDCDPCLAGIAELQKNIDLLKAKQIVPLLINYNEKRSHLDRWLTGNQSLRAFMLAHDKFGYSGPEYGINTDPADPKGTATLPLTVVVGADGLVKAIITDKGSDYVETIVKSVLPFL